MKKTWEILLYLWQLPQNLLGLLLVAIYKPESSFDMDGVRIHYAKKMKGGISLGKYILMSYDYNEYNGASEKHEYGHTRQSIYLGPLYLLVIGLPSLLWVLWWNRDRGMSYYSFYTEAWADRLGGVNRG
jgi:hypothetical protein